MINGVMAEALFWIYLVNAILLINHEIDSAFWQEWKLFKLPGGISGFLLLHFPLLFFVLYGVVLVYQQVYMGLIFSLILSAGGLFAFTAHMYFIKMGRDEFKSPISLAILVSTFVVSGIQTALTIYLLIA